MFDFFARLFSRYCDRSLVVIFANIGHCGFCMLLLWWQVVDKNLQPFFRDSNSFWITIYKQKLPAIFSRGFTRAPATSKKNQARYHQHSNARARFALKLATVFVWGIQFFLCYWLAR